MPENTPVESWRKDHWWTAEELKMHYTMSNDPGRWSTIIRALKDQTPERFISWRQMISPTNVHFGHKEIIVNPETKTTRIDREAKFRVTQIATWYRGERFDTGIVIGLWQLISAASNTSRPQDQIQATMTLVSRDYRGIQLVSACSTGLRDAAIYSLESQPEPDPIHTDLMGLMIEVRTMLARRGEGIWVGIMNELEVDE